MTFIDEIADGEQAKPGLTAQLESTEKAYDNKKADEVPIVSIPVLDVLFYESQKAESETKVIKDVFKVTDISNKAVLAVVTYFLDKGLLKRGDSLREPIELLSREGGSIGSISSYIEQYIPENQRYFLTVLPYEKQAALENEIAIPRTYDELKRAYDAFGEDSSGKGKIDMFVFNSYGGNGELEKVISRVDEDFPLLKNCLWIACRHESEPLSEAVESAIKKRKENRVYPYTNKNSLVVTEYVVEKIIEYVQKLKIKEKKKRIEETRKTEIIERVKKRDTKSFGFGDIKPKDMTTETSAFPFNS